MKKILLPILTAAAVSSASASLIVNEHFNYSTGALSTTAATGTGLTGNWGGAVASGVISGTAGGAIVNTWSYTPPTNYAPAPTFNQYDTGGGNQFSAAELSSSIGTGSDATYYLSYFFRVGTTGNVGSSYAQVGLANTNSNNLDYFNIGKSSATSTFDVKFGADATEASSIAVAVDTDYFVVAKLSILASGTDSLAFKVYTSADTLPVSEPVTWDYTATAALAGSFTGIGFRNGLGQTDFKSDEFRLGTTWADVTVPEPTTWALLAGGLTTLMVFRRRRQS